MARRLLDVESQQWEVFPSGRVTVYGQDQFGLMFQLGTGPERKRRFTRYAPTGSRHPDASLRELSERQLLDLFQQSQPAWTAPESAYGAR
jgi:hypothetical protein